MFSMGSKGPKSEIFEAKQKARENSRKKNAEETVVKLKRVHFLLGNQDYHMANPEVEKESGNSIYRRGKL